MNAISSSPSQELSKVVEMFKADDGRDDKNIDSYFVETDCFRRLSPEASHVITGRYGSGKTAFVRRLVRRQAKVQLISISLRADLFGEELQTANANNEYGTFAQALVYLHTLYGLAESSSGSLTTGDKAALIGELRALNLQPYGDLISRLAAAVGQAVDKVKKLDVAKVFSIELQQTTATEINMARYRQMCLKIQPLVYRQFGRGRTLVVIDEMDAPARLAKQTSALIGVLLRWLKEVERTTNGTLRFLLAVPEDLLRIGLKSAEIYTPGQDLFAEVKWAPAELEQLVLDRIRAALSAKISPSDWLLAMCSLKLGELHDLTFGRPRNYIQLVRNCLRAKLADPTRDASTCRDIGLRDYARQTLLWLQAEWQGTSDGFSDLLELLYEVENVISTDKLRVSIDDIRKRGILSQRGLGGIIQDLEKWRLIKKAKGVKGGKIEYRPHPLIKLAGQSDFI